MKDLWEAWMRAGDEIDCHENFPARHGDIFRYFPFACLRENVLCEISGEGKINRIGEWHNRLDVCGTPVGIRKIFSLFRSSISQAFAASSCCRIFRAWLWKWEGAFVVVAIHDSSTRGLPVFPQWKLEGYKWKQKLRASFRSARRQRRRRRTVAKNYFPCIDLHLYRIVSCFWFSMVSCRVYRALSLVIIANPEVFYDTKFVVWLFASSIELWVASVLVKSIKSQAPFIGYVYGKFLCRSRFQSMAIVNEIRSSWKFVSKNFVC